MNKFSFIPPWTLFAPIAGWLILAGTLLGDGRWYPLLLAVGLIGSVLAAVFRKCAMRSQASMGFQSMKKHGPPPCGMNQVGMRVEFVFKVFIVPLEPAVLTPKFPRRKHGDNSPCSLC